ncbi:MAG: hypothetical protein WD669_07355 [Pirellulales bacterium]
MSANASPNRPAASSASAVSADHPGAPHPHLLTREETRPEVVARLEWLDDLMFAAIDGDATALQEASDAWRKLRDELGADTVEESRQQYLRCAQGVWHSLRFQPNHSPEKVFAAIEVISLLTGRAR